MELLETFVYALSQNSSALPKFLGQLKMFFFLGVERQHLIIFCVMLSESFGH